MTAIPATAATSRIVDRTFRCTPFALGDGLRDLDVAAWPRGSSGNLHWSPSPGYLGVSSGGFSPTSDLLSVRVHAWQRFRTRRVPAGVYARPRRCSSARVSVPLSPTGLPRPPVRFGKEVACPVRGSVLVRVRAVLESPSPWQGIDRWYVGARGNVLEATLAVRSERPRRPIALVQLRKSGQTRLWTASACT